MSRGIAHCHLSAHTGFPLPCVRCANPVMDLPRANSMRRMPPPRTSAEDRAARRANDALASQRARKIRRGE